MKLHSHDKTVLLCEIEYGTLLNILLEKDVKFHWEKEQQEAFEEIKNVLCTAPVLEYPLFDEPFIITTDASNFALGAVLSQGEIGKAPQ